ncbi:sugar-binding protein [Gracilibacillus caseinilyticus]|uniref:Sugar-binding protein n=1 Tax=Gracilibacillus caseinilyticus TaxID=2932256 RepID=A0ABY4EZB3_9BACI|nr:sugar-binding protein [Gracilibacillus caseinilyticus]UOQ49295.1 sugar-binding protein [Gracilibacillus caseinilyticus]
MSRRKIIYLIFITIFVVSCGFSLYFFIQSQRMEERIEAETSSEQLLPAYQFALIGEELDHDYWRLVGQGAKDVEQDYDVSVAYEGPRRSNPDEQMKLLDIAIKSKVDGIIVQAINEKFLPVINQAMSNGIPVITIDTDAPKSDRLAYVGTDNYEAGKLAGDTLVEDLDGNATVGIVTGSFDNAHHQLRVEGFKEAIAQAPEVEIVAIEESNITRVVAEEKAYNMLKEHPDIDALYGTSALDGIGMVEAAASLGVEESIYMLAFDTLPENIELLKQEKIDVLIGQKPYEMGSRSVELMMKLMEGEAIEDVYHTDTSVVRPEDVGEQND